MATSADPSTTAVHRPPPPVVVAVVLGVVRAAFGAFGLVYFGVFATDVNPDAGTPFAIAFAAIGLLLVVTVVACLAGLWRGRRTAWHVLTCCLSALIFFGCYKIFAEGESDSVVFLAVDLALLGLVLTPAARRHVTGAGPTLPV